MATSTGLISSALNLQGGGAAVPPITSAGNSLGVQATGPVKPAVVTTIPKTQATPTKDLSSTYANVNGTIYNKQTGSGYSTPDQFFKDSGVSDFNNLKFDTAWSPQTVNNGGTPSTPVSSSVPAPVIPPVPATTTPSPTSAPTTPNTTTSGANVPLVNGGTTGVSQGGLIGGLTTNATNNSALANAQATLTADQKQLADQIAQLHGQAFGQSYGQGAIGVLQTALNAKIAADQQGVSNALAGQSNTTSGLSAAASANAPIIASPGQIQLSPSQPTPGATTSGAANLNSLVGQRAGADGKTTEFFNKSTGQGFATPQALADFVNQQQPGINANASNVFSLLQTQGQGGSNLLGLPQSTLQTYAQLLASGQGSAIPGSVTGNTALMAQLYQMAKQIDPNFNFNVAAGQGSAQSAITNTQTQQVASWKSAQQIAQGLTGQLQPLLSQVNPSQLSFVNGVIQAAANQAGNPTYQQTANLLTEIANTYAQVLTPPNGTVTDGVRSAATGMLNGLASGQSIAQVIAGLDAQAQAKIGAASTATTLGSLTGNSNLSIPAGSLAF